MLGGFAARWGLAVEQAAQIGSAFGGGMAGTGQICGAVIGALMVLGLAHGPAAPREQERKQKTYALARDLFGRFQGRHGSLLCRELLGVDIGTPEGYQAAMRDGLFRTRCPAFVRAAAEIAAQLV